MSGFHNIFLDLVVLTVKTVYPQIDPSRSMLLTAFNPHFVYHD